MVTLEEVVKDVLLPHAEVLAGRDYMHRSVEGVLVVKHHPPGLSEPSASDLILASTQALAALSLTQSRAIESLHGSAAALVIRGPVVPDAVPEAERYRLPLLRIPETVSLQVLEREVMRYLGDRRSALYRRKHTLLQDLTALAVQGRGLTALAEHMARASGNAVTFENEDGEVIAWAMPTGVSRQDRQRLQTAMDRPDSMSDQELSDLSRVSVPVIVRDGQIGRVSMLGHPDHLGENAQLVLDAGATAGAVELARDRAVRDTVHRIEGDLVAELVAGTGDRDELERRAARMGYDLDRPYIGCAFLPVTASGEFGGSELLDVLRYRLSRVLPIFDVEAPAYLDGTVLTVFYPVDEGTTQAVANRLAERLRGALTESGGRYTLIAGVSRPHTGPSSFQMGYREARRTLEAGRALVPDRSVISFADLGVYRVLFALRDSPELEAFYEDTLGALARHDREKKSELLPTLEAFLFGNNASEAAVRLNLHRNSLLYRLRRIQEITGVNLDDPEVRFTLQLALRIGETRRTQRLP